MSTDKNMSVDKEKEEFEHDWYGILGCDKNSSVAEIERAARNSSRKYHPDINPDPNAQSSFILVQRAKEILLDVTKRGIIDEFYKRKTDLIASKLKRDSQMDVSRKRARDDLESKIKQASEPKIKLSHDEVIHNEVKNRAVNISEIHKKNSSFIIEVNEYAQQLAVYKKAQNFENIQRTMSADDIPNSSEIKIKWKRNAVSHSDDTLHQIFKKFGTIEQVVIRSGTSALVTYSQESYAKLAVQAYANSQGFQVSLSSEKKKANIFTFDYKSQSQETDSKLAKEIARSAEKGKIEETLSDLRGDSNGKWNGRKQMGHRDTERDFHIDYNSYLTKEAFLFAQVMQFEAVATTSVTEINV